MESLPLNEKTKKFPKNSEKWKIKRKEKDAQLEEELTSAGLKEQIIYLKSKGFDRLKQMHKALVINEGDQEKALSWLESKKNRILQCRKRREDKENTMNEEISSNPELSSKLETLKSKLNLKLRKLLKALQKNDSDVEKALKWLTEKSDKILRRERKYKKRFPDDKEVDWDKFKKTQKDKREGRRSDKYKKAFPNDTKEDWAKFKDFKKEQGIQKEKDKIERDQLLKNEWGDYLTIYLDGNNMLMIDSVLRGLFLKKKKKEAAERVAELSIMFSKLMKVNCVLVFDITQNCFETESEGVRISVCSARPNFESSDDALVEWAGGLSADNLAKTLFVTSDRALLTRLIRKGAVHLMKSKAWWTIMMDKLGSEIYKGIISKK
jgi:hypothetical protein